MSVNIGRLVQRYMNKQAADSPKAPTPVAFINLSKFYMAFEAYTEAVSVMEGAEPPKAIEKEGITLGRKMLPQVMAGIQDKFVPVAKEIRAVTNMRDVARGKGSDRMANIGYGLSQMYPKAKRRGDTLKKMFGKQEEHARKLSMAAATEEPLSRLNALASLPTTRGLPKLRAWILKASEALGVPPTETEKVMSSASAAKDIGRELREVEAAIDNTPADSPKAAALQQERMTLLNDLQDTADSSVNKDVVLSTAAAEKTKNDGFVQSTETGRRLSMSPQQEAAMVAEGRKTIAAGAGSGKTRILAGEVVYRINEMGVPAHAICAVSFTRKSSEELVGRINDYGAVIDGAGRSGFGSTHQIAGRVLNKYGQAFRRPKYFDPRQESWIPSTLIALAVRQVSLSHAAGGGDKCPKPADFFTGQPVDLSEAAQNTPVPVYVSREQTEEQTREFLDAMNKLLDFFEYGWPSRGKFRDWSQKRIREINNIARQVHDGQQDGSFLIADIPQYEKNKINKDLGRNGVGSSYRIASTRRTAAKPRNAPEDENIIERKGMTKYGAWNKPAGEWFNLGFSWEGGGKEGEEGEQMSAAAVKRKIDIWKGKGASPEEVWYASGAAEDITQPYTPEAAAYAAYEWLKGPKGEPDFRNAGDLTDLQHDAIRTLVHSARGRKAVQSRFNVVMVDEAQDLNRTQHLLFGLMAGYLDHRTLEPREDGKMTAEVFSFVGDDKQAIYEFRGAEPDEFIDKSDQYGGGFSTHLLDTNYRSGQAIVDAANKLIAHNKKQIQMVCKANYEVKGDGAIRSRSFDDQRSAAGFVAEEILGTADELETERKKWGNFGIAVRSNAEAAEYALAMIKYKIPFQSKTDPFKAPHMKAMLGWLTVVEQGEGGDARLLIRAIRDCKNMPTSFLGDAFMRDLKTRGKDAPLQWLLHVADYGDTLYGKNVRKFANNIRKALDMHGSPDAPNEIYSELLSVLEGAKGDSFLDTVRSRLMKDAGAMAELAANNPDGIPTDAQIEEAVEDKMLILDGLTKADDSITGIMEYVRDLQAVNDRTNTKKAKEEKKDAVYIGTMHSWKGLECPKLFVPMVRGKFPRMKMVKNPDGTLECMPPSEDDPALASERRLAYVAITRAEEDCVILDIPNPSPSLDCPPSQFISEACIPSNSEDPDLIHEPGDSDTVRVGSQQMLLQLWGDID